MPRFPTKQYIENLYILQNMCEYVLPIFVNTPGDQINLYSHHHCKNYL